MGIIFLARRNRFLYARIQERDTELRDSRAQVFRLAFLFELLAKKTTKTGV
jgi:hypothetical protein